MSYIPGSYGGDTGDVLGDDAYVPPGGYSNIPGYVPPPAPAGTYADYDAMLAASAAAIAAEQAAGGYQGPGEHYVDASGNPISVEEGRALLYADALQQATANAASIAATPGYTGGGEDFIANQVAQSLAITRASQGFTGDDLYPELPPIAPESNPLYPVPPAATVSVVYATPTPSTPDDTGGGTTSGGGGLGPSATVNYPPVETTPALPPRPRPSTTEIKPPTGTTTGPTGAASSSSSSTRTKVIVAGVALALLGVAVATSKPSRRR
jgi:hypothetical protein